MRRRAPDESVEKFRVRKVEAYGGELRSAVEEWAAVYIDLLAETEPQMPDGVTDRAADIWEPVPQNPSRSVRLADSEVGGSEPAKIARRQPSAGAVAAPA